MGFVADAFAHVESEGLAGGATGWGLVERVTGDEPLPNRLVTISEDGGSEPETPSTQGIGDGAMMEVGVQIKIRGRPGKGIEAQEKAEEIRVSLHGLLRQTVGDHYYSRIKAMTGEPVFIGWDSRNRPEFTIAFRGRRRVVQ